MWDFGWEGRGRPAIGAILGAAGTVAIGLLIRRVLGGEGVPDRLREISVPERFRPARLRRDFPEQSELRLLEDDVISALLDDDLLSERAIDVGAISHGMVELSGTVGSIQEGRRAVRLARGVEGVDSVVNRLEIDENELAEEVGGREWTGLRVGMGRRRQGVSTDPDRHDDAQPMRETAIEQADRDDFERQGHHRQPRVGSRPEVTGRARIRYSEDELDNQFPRGSAPADAADDPTPSRKRGGAKAAIRRGLQRKGLGG